MRELNVTLLYTGSGCRFFFRTSLAVNRIFLLFFAACLAFQSSLAADFGPSKPSFIANAGQWSGMHSHEAPLGNGTIFFMPGSLRIALMDPEEVHNAHHQGRMDSASFHFHALFVDFPGSHKPEAQLGGTKADYPLYYYQSDRTITQYSYSELIYEDLYDGIDMLWHGLESGLKYDFVVKPGADPNQIRIRYQGAEQIRIHEGRVLVQTSLGDWMEDRPYAYQAHGRQRTEVPCRFRLEAGVLRFEFPAGYDPSRPLVIDPTLIFSTYSGAQSDNFGFTATPDLAGNMYSAGIIFGPNFPVTPGAAQDTFVGNTFDPSITLRFDIGILKFNPNGTNVLYAGFLGGSRIERPHSIIANDAGELYVMGSTSSPDFPTTANAFDNSFDGGYDIFVTRLSSDGNSLLSSTFFGGAANDGLNSDGSLRYNFADEFRGDVFITTNNDVVIASMTSSPGLGTVGAFQPNYGGGISDGLVVRFSPDLATRRWSSYVGGDQTDALYAVKEGLDGAIILAGTSRSANLTLPGFGYQTTPQGGSDGIIVRLLGTDGSGITGTFLGSPGDEQIYFIDIDGEGRVYANGTTDSTLVTRGTNYNDPNSGQYIARFSIALGNLDWLGRYGSRSGSPEMSLSAFVVDLCNNVYVSGWTGKIGEGPGGTNVPGPTNLALTNNAYQTTSNGGDFYLAAFGPGMLTLQYSTYFGGGISYEHVDGGTSRFDKRGLMYQAVCAGCRGNNDFPTTPNAFATSNGAAGGCNNAALKLAFQLESGLGASFGWQQPPTYCFPLDLQLQNNSRIVNNTSYFWEVSNGDTSTLPNPVFTFTEAGTYSIFLRISSPNACNGFDTLRRFVTVYGPPPVQLPSDTCICLEDGFLLQANIPGDVYAWTGPVMSTDASITPTETGLYKLRLTDANGCVGSDSINIVIIECFKDFTNVITPNGDGLNDRVRMGSSDFNDFEMLVVNRWGQVVFRTTDPLAGWGGETQSGVQLVEGGNYFIRLKATFCDNRSIERDYPIRVVY